MKCYIYAIVNQITNQRYIGQTTNFSRRKNEHLTKLRKGVHPNKKLQNSYNKYGEDSFTFEKIVFDNISKQELNEKEVYYIQFYNSYENGFNLTLGGDGGDTRSKLNLEQYLLAYFGNQKYSGMTNRTGAYLNVDSSCISAIRRGIAYEQYKQIADTLSEEEKNKYIKQFEQIFDIKNNPPKALTKVNDELTLKIICVVSCYGNGAESAIVKHFDLSKGFIYHFVTGTSREHLKQEYICMSDEQIKEIGHKYFIEWDLQSYSNRTITKKFHRIIGCEP